jgi:hypothetical protein
MATTTTTTTAKQQNQCVNLVVVVRMKRFALTVSAEGNFQSSAGTSSNQ